MSVRHLRLDPALTKIAKSAFVASNATIIGDVHVGDEASIWFGVIIRGDTDEIRVGARSNIQDGTVMHADPGFPCVVGKEVTVGHRAILHGAHIHDRVLVGMGATVMNGAVVESDTMIGANALVREGQHIPSRSLVLGIPAKVVRQLTDPEVAMLRMSAAHYVESGQEYIAAGFDKPAK